MIVNLNFSLEAWIKNLEVEAESEEAAVQKLMSMSLEDFIEGNVSDLHVSEVDAAIVEYSNVTVKVSDVVYDLDPEIMDVSVIEYLKNFLPKEWTIDLKGVRVDDNIEELIKDYIFDETNYDTKSFEFQILEKR